MKASIRYLLSTVLTLASFVTLHAQTGSTTEYYKAPKASAAPVIDGKGDEASWNDADWISIGNVYIGPAVTAADFSGRYKVIWTSSRLYILAEIKDNILRDVNTPALHNFWDDDCLELFLDENKSGGNHQYNYNAFAYHMAINNQDVADYGTDQQAHLFNDHITSVKTVSGTTYTWEVSVKVFGDNFVYGQNNTPLTLAEGKIMGYNLAYCDNDAAQTRENFIGSRYLAPAIANNGYINADVFAKLELVAAPITTGIDVATSTGTFNVYPNPVLGDVINLSHESNINIFTIEGKLVMSANKVSSVEVASFPVGIYILKTDKGDVSKFTKL